MTTRDYIKASQSEIDNDTMTLPLDSRMISPKYTPLGHTALRPNVQSGLTRELIANLAETDATWKTKTTLQ